MVQNVRIPLAQVVINCRSYFILCRMISQKFCLLYVSVFTQQFVNKVTAVVEYSNLGFKIKIISSSSIGLESLSVLSLSSLPE